MLSRNARPSRTSIHMKVRRYHFIYQSLKLPAFGVLLYNTMDNLGMILSLCVIPVLNVFIDMELNTCHETLYEPLFSLFCRVVIRATTHVWLYDVGY